MERESQRETLSCSQEISINPKPTLMCSSLEAMICTVQEQFVLSNKMQFTSEPRTTAYKKECVTIGWGIPEVKHLSNIWAEWKRENVI